MCLASAFWARVDRIVYANTRADAAAIGFDDAFIYDEIPKDPGERALPAESICRWRRRGRCSRLGWRRRIGWSTRPPPTFSGTPRPNLRPCPEALPGATMAASRETRAAC